MRGFGDGLGKFAEGGSMVRAVGAFGSLSAVVAVMAALSANPARAVEPFEVATDEGMVTVDIRTSAAAYMANRAALPSRAAEMLSAEDSVLSQAVRDGLISHRGASEVARHLAAMGATARDVARDPATGESFVRPAQDVRSVGGSQLVFLLADSRGMRGVRAGLLDGDGMRLVSAEVLGMGGLVSVIPARSPAAPPAPPR